MPTNARLAPLVSLMGVMADFETFYRELHPRLVTTLAAVSGDRDLAIDAADEAAARALAHWDQVEVMDKPDGWLYRVGLNYLRRQVRRRGFEQTWLRRQRSQRHVDGPTGEIWNLVADLAPRQREAIVLR